MTFVGNLEDGGRKNCAALAAMIFPLTAIAAVVGMRIFCEDVLHASRDRIKAVYGDMNASSARFATCADAGSKGGERR